MWEMWESLEDMNLFEKQCWDTQGDESVTPMCKWTTNNFNFDFILIWKQTTLSHVSENTFHIKLMKGVHRNNTDSFPIVEDLLEIHI